MDQLRSYLRDQAALVLANEGTGTEQIHDARVAVRRLRSAIRVFGVDDSLDADLRWFAGLLGAVRDLQMQRERFRAADLDTEFLEQRLYDDQLTHEEALREAMAGRRWRRLRKGLEAWSKRPPAGPSSKTWLRELSRAAARKARKRLAQAGSDATRHRARKAVKRARYAAEVAGRKQAADRFRHLQDVYGDLQDAVVAAATLERLARSASPEQAFTLGVLYAREVAERDRLRGEVADVRSATTPG